MTDPMVSTGDDAQLSEYKNRVFAAQTVEELLRVLEGIEQAEKANKKATKNQ